jgi:hypothetical protein
MSILSARGLAPLLALALSAPVLGAQPETAREDTARYREWVQAMKQAARGPFRRIRWFCADGTVLDPKPYACKDHGGGRQHGEWNARTVELRERGLRIATVLAALDPDALLGTAGHRVELAQILVEQFLIRVDDGWILRRARFYRGAFQEEDEREGARKLLLAILASDPHLARDYALVRAAAQLLPHGRPSRSASRVRQLSADLSERDRSFLTLRNKIHVRPEPADAEAVRTYARGVNDAGLAEEYADLAAAIDTLFTAPSSDATLTALARRAKPGTPVHRLATDAARRVAGGTDAAKRFVELAVVLASLRDVLGDVSSPELRLAVLDASLDLESDLFAAATAIDEEALARATRRQRTHWLDAAAQAVFGVGLLSPRQRDALRASARSLAPPQVSLAVYKRELGYLSLVPAWGSQRLRFHFGEAMRILGAVEPKASRFIEDALRGSPLFVYARVLDGLVRDANRLAGVRNELAGRDVGAGLRALNPGLTRGRLLRAPQAGAEYAQDGIYVLPETAADLPPVAGILTAGEGNPLSHVQLLARNLGIPNVGVDDSLLPSLAPLYGRRVILAVSAAGSVRLTEDTGQGDALFARRDTAREQTLIRPDLDKLNLEQRDLLALSSLRADDSGRTVGPKAAKLGELKHQFPEAVEEGLTIPFGVFRRMLEQPRGAGTVFEWMQSRYRELEAMAPDSERRHAATESFRAELYDWVLNADPGDVFRDRLRAKMSRVFGADGSYGVFVRSDTNVEDLPGFTGAGLNLTVPNVVGVDRVIAALSRVWASPFTARAFAWRQAHMDRPEHVYPAVLLLRSVPAEKSGVMVTRDIDSGADGWLSVAVNEGVGGAVDGQAAESLRIETATGRVRLLAQATAPWRRRVSLQGGVDKLPASGRDHVLEPGEIGQLIELARVLPERFPSIVDDTGRAAPADIEFGFLDGRLRLFQIRPFLESKRARGNAYLTSLDAGLTDLEAVQVSMDELPR